MLGNEIGLQTLGQRGHHAFGDGGRQVRPARQGVGDRGAFVVVVDHPLEGVLAQRGTLVSNQMGDGSFIAGVDQGVGHGLGNARALGDRNLLCGLAAAHDLDQVVVGQNLRELEHRQGDAIDVAGQGERHVVGQFRGRLEVGRERLAHQNLGVLDQGAEDVLGDSTLGIAQRGGIELGRDLGGGSRPGPRRGIAHQMRDVGLGQVFRSGFLGHLIQTVCNYRPRLEGPKQVPRMLGACTEPGSRSFGLLSVNSG